MLAVMKGSDGSQRPITGGEDSMVSTVEHLGQLDE
jgi:hypothetical protein